MNAFLLALMMGMGLQHPTPPPVVPIVSPDLSPFEQAKKYTQMGDYEASLILLAAVKPNKDIYNEYCFLMAVNHFALNDKLGAEKWIKAINDTFEPLQRRHASLVFLMEEDIKHWKEGDLNDIERDMRKSADRLNNAQAGDKTQVVQKQIVDKLDKLIKEQEDKAAAAAAAANAPKGPDGKPLPQPPGAAPGQQPNQPAADSVVMGGKGEGKVDEKKLRQYAENWGTLPPAQRAKVVEEITRDLPPKYKPMIDEYFKALNRMHPK